jgi:hypothetical protein
MEDMHQMEDMQLMLGVIIVSDRFVALVEPDFFKYSLPSWADP